MTISFIMVAILHFQGTEHCYVCDSSLLCRMWPTSAPTATVWWDGTRPNWDEEVCRVWGSGQHCTAYKKTFIEKKYIKNKSWTTTNTTFVTRSLTLPSHWECSVLTYSVLFVATNWIKTTIQHSLFISTAKMEQLKTPPSRLLQERNILWSPAPRVGVIFLNIQ